MKRRMEVSQHCWKFIYKHSDISIGWLCWGLTSQSTIFQSCRDGAIASWVINQYFRGVKCLAQGLNTAAVGLEPRTSRSGVRHSTTEPPRSRYKYICCMSPILFFIIFFICTGVGKIFLQINSAAVAFIDILIAVWEGLNDQLRIYFHTKIRCHWYSAWKRWYRTIQGKLWRVVLTIPYGPVKPYGSTEYISKKWTWSYLSLFFISPEPKSHSWAYSIGKHPSSVCHRLSTFSNDMSSEALKPILTKFHI